jgi:formin-binding protein 1
LTTLEARAAEHDRFGTELIVHVAEPLKQVANRFEELRKSHAEYSAKLEKERDSAYADLKKAKGKYDGVCQEVENKRKKAEGAFDHGRGKAQNSYQQQLMEMRNAKNTYLININVTNKLKERYYHEYVPDLLDSLQDLSETRVAKLNSIWSLAAQLETGTLSRSMEQIKHLSSEILRNSPLLDSMMFARHNIANWNEPLDMVFEPSPVWLDDAGMAIDESSKVFLRNILGRSKGQLRELKSEADKKSKEVQGARMVRANVRAGKDKRDELELVRAIFSLQGDLHEAERKRLTAEVEVSTITSVVGDVSLGAKNHNFKSQTFKIPTNCDLCGERIWGLSAKGFDCRDCGYTCHSKCEMKVPPECPGEQSKEDKRKLKIERQEAANAVVVESPTNGTTSASPALTRQDTMTSLSSGYATTAQRSLSGRTVPTVASLDENSAPTPEPSAPAPKPAAKPIAGRKNRIVAPPPAAYVSGGPTSNGASGGDSGLKPGEKKGKMLYPYDANADGELSVGEGKDVVIMEEDGTDPLSHHTLA